MAFSLKPASRLHQMCDPVIRLSYLDKRVVQQGTGSPAALGFALQTVSQKILPLCAQLFRNGRLVAHSHFIHDLEVVLVLVPRSLNKQTEKQDETSFLMWICTLTNTVSSCTSHALKKTIIQSNGKKTPKIYSQFVTRSQLQYILLIFLHVYLKLSG